MSKIAMSNNQNVQKNVQQDEISKNYDDDVKYNVFVRPSVGFEA